MRLDVVLTPGELSAGEIQGRTVVVIDVLRATSTMVQALAAGARALYPVASIEEALRLAHSLGRDEVLLCGERRCLPIEGFDLGNSPGDFVPDRVGGKTLIMSTTNGTTAVSVAAAAERVVVAAWLNLSAVVDDLARSGAEPILLCSGREGRFGLEDAVCAGEMVRALAEARPDAEWRLNDAAQAALELARLHPDPAALFPRTAAGHAIAAAGLEEDLAFCARVDLHDIVPVLDDRQITLSPSGAAVSDS